MTCKYCRGTKQVDISFGGPRKLVECLECSDTTQINSADDCLAAQYVSYFITTYQNWHELYNDCATSGHLVYTEFLNDKILDNPDECTFAGQKDHYLPAELTSSDVDGHIVFKDKSILYFQGEWKTYSPQVEKSNKSSLAAQYIDALRQKYKTAKELIYATTIIRPNGLYKDIIDSEIIGAPNICTSALFDVFGERGTITFKDDSKIMWDNNIRDWVMR